jgi:hypothetical protein
MFSVLKYAAPPGLTNAILLAIQGLTPLAISCRRSAANAT